MREAAALDWKDRKERAIAKMKGQSRSRRRATSALLPVATAALAAGIFIVDILTPPDVVVSGLYVVVVLMASRFCRPSGVALVAAGCIGLVLAAYFFSAETAINAAIRIPAIGAAALLALQSLSAEAGLREQAGLLDLTHDTIIARRFDDDVITYWNRGAEEMYGWHRAEAVGRVGYELAKTIFPVPLDQIKAELLRVGRFEGEFVNRKRDGTPVLVTSRWTLQRDRRGRPAVILVTSNDITERKRAEQALRESEERWRRLFETSAAGMALEGLDGVFTAANPALQRMLGRTEEEIVGHNVLELNHEDERAATADALAKFRSGSLTERHVEKKYLKKDGSLVWLDITTTLVPAIETAAPFLQAVYVDVTRRVQSEAALRASNERWRAIFESAAVGIATGDLDGGVLSMNPAFQRTLGYTEDEIRNLTVFEFTHEEDRAETRRFFSAIITGRQTSYRFEKRYRRKDGATIWADVSASMVPATDTTPAFLAVMAVDITDRKQAEAALRASEERWRAMFETAPVGIATLDFGHRSYLTANESFQRMTGYSENELRQLTTLDITHEDDRAATQGRIDSAIVGVLQRKRYRRKDGEVIWADVTPFVVPATDGTPAFLGAVIVDVTDRRRAEDALRRSEAYLNEVFDTFPDGVSIIGRDYRYQRVNHTYEVRTGLGSEQIVGMHLADRVGLKAFNEIVKTELDRCLAGEHVSYAYWLTPTNSGRRYLEVTYAPIFISGPNQASAALAITRDLTEYMLASEALRQAQADLARLNRIMLLGEMTSSIAHEVNQPIAAVITNANAGLRWLGARPPNLEEARQTLARIVRDGNRAGEVIDRVRALTRKVPPRRDRLDLGEVIREVTPLTQAELQRNEVRWQTRIADGLPLVPGDQVQLQQVIINLVVNAVEAMSEVVDRPRELTIVAGKGDSNELFVEVQDTGPGLDQANLDRLFHSFYTTKPEGMGMGLAISRSIVEAHGGRLSAAPNEPHGAVFRFTLPVEGASSPHSVPSPS